MKKILLLIAAVITSILLVGCDSEPKAEVSTPEEFFSALFRYTDSPKHKDTPKTIILTADLDFSGYEWKTGYNCPTLDGNGHSLKNITIQVSEGAKVGMFKTIGKIQDVHIENLNVTYYGKDGIVGGVAAASGGTFSNVKITGKIHAPSAKCVGGVIGQVRDTDAVLKDIDIAIKVTGGNYVGGAIGLVDGNGYKARAVTLENVTNRGEIISKAATTETDDGVTSESYVGGLVGVYYSDSGTVNNCKNYGTIKSKKYSGGLFGDASISSCKNSTNEGAVSTEKSEIAFTFAGGIAGALNVKNTIENCKNTAVIESTGASGYGGGIAGYLYAGGQIISSKNAGHILANAVGGMVGYCEDNSQFVMCENTGEVGTLDKTLAGGGIVGFAKNAFVNQCTNSGSVSGYCAAGIAGKYSVADTNMEGAVISSSNSGKITASMGGGYAAGIIALMENFEMLGIDTNTNTGELSGWKTDEIANIE